jgi:hypothetical protein
MKRTVYVARTSYDLNHINRLANPDFGIVSLKLVASGGSSSKCYLPDDSPQPAPAGGSDNFHFIPEYETVEIKYEIKDKFALIDGAKFEMFTRFDKAPLWTLDLKPLGPDWWAHGKHAVKWDGRVVKPDAEQAGTSGEGGLTHDLTTIALNKNLKSLRDGYFTLENPPYKLKLTVSSTQANGNPVTAWTFWHILLAKIELELGPEEAIPAKTVNSPRHKEDKDVRSRIVAKGGIPASGGSVEVVLVSNVYTKVGGDFDTDAGFTEYQKLWDDGPQIPLVAKIRLSDSANAVVKIDETAKGAVALGGARFLWDWEDPAENVAGQQGPAAAPLAFINDAINYYNAGTDATRAAADHTYPKGDNCHVDHGGKRGPSAQPVFPPQDGYIAADTLVVGSCPFQVKPCTDRTWAALSRGWTRGKLKGKTGVIFQPSRMGGDDYVVKAYLAYDKTAKDKLALDAKTEPLVAPDVIQSATGKFQIWREVHVARYITKVGVAVGLLPNKLPGVQTNFTRAYVHIENKMGAANAYGLSQHTLPGGAALDYNTLLRSRLTGSGNIFYTADLATDPTADHSGVDSMVKVRTYANFVKKLHAYTFPTNAASDMTALATGLGVTEDVAAEGLGTWNGSGGLAPVAALRLTTTKSLLINYKAEIKTKYSRTVDWQIFGIGEPFAGDLQLVAGGNSGGAQAPDGVVTVEFNYTNTYLRDLIAAGINPGYLYGGAMHTTDCTRSQCVILFWQAREDFFSHEFGHHFFLPHAKYPTGTNQPGGFRVNRHDDTDSGCLMSYSNVRPAFCGLCQLRIRGWSADGIAGATAAVPLNKISANNKKP